METVSSDIGFRVNFGLLFWGAKFFRNGYLAHFLLEIDEIWQYYRSGKSKLIPNFVNFGPGVP